VVVGGATGGGTGGVTGGVTGGATGDATSGVTGGVTGGVLGAVAVDGLAICFGATSARRETRARREKPREWWGGELEATTVAMAISVTMTPPTFRRDRFDHFRYIFSGRDMG
jgi:hypothetical protein